MANLAGYSYRETLNRLIIRCIADEKIYGAELLATCKGAGEDYNTVVDHIASEIRLNREDEDSAWDRMVAGEVAMA